jgi:hypothetical protein
LENLYTQHTKKDTRLTDTDITDLISESISKFKTKYVIVDALDELDDNVRLPLLKTLHGFEEANLMVTSRDVISITSRFGSPSSVMYCDGCNKSDLRSFHHCEGCDSFDLCPSCFDEQKRCPHSQHTYIIQFCSESLKIAAHTHDLHNFIQWKIDCSETLQRFTTRDPNLQSQIEKRVVKVAKGM